MKNSKDTIGNRTRNLPACSVVPKPTTCPHPTIGRIITHIEHRKHWTCSIRRQPFIAWISEELSASPWSSSHIYHRLQCKVSWDKPYRLV